MGDLSGISQVVVFSLYFEKRSKYEVSNGLAPDPLGRALDLDSPKLAIARIPQKASRHNPGYLVGGHLSFWGHRNEKGDQFPAVYFSRC